MSQYTFSLQQVLGSAYSGSNTVTGTVSNSSGSVFSLGGSQPSQISVQTVFSGTFANGAVTTQLQGSNDGATFYNIGSGTLTGSGLVNVTGVPPVNNIKVLWQFASGCIISGSLNTSLVANV